MKRFLIAGVLVLCLMSSQFARADEARDAKIKSQMVQNYLLWQNAYKNKDAARIISFESPDFTYVSANGNIDSKATADENWHKLMRMTRTVNSAKVEIKKVSIEPNRVVVWNKQYLDLGIVVANEPEHHESVIISLKDVWVEYDGIWMLKRIEELSVKFPTDKKTK